MSALPAIAIVVLGLIVSALASLAEAAILSTNRLRMRGLLGGGERKAAAVDDLLTRPRQVLSSLVFLNTLALVITSATGVLLAVDRWSDAIGGWSIAAGIAVMCVLVLILGEIMPKAIASQWPERTAMALVRPVGALSRLLGPVVSALEGLTGFVLRPFGWRGEVAPLLISEEELQLLLSLGQEHGLIEPDEREMIHNVFELEDTTVREVMVPRLDIVAADVTEDPAGVIRRMVAAGRSRIPIYEENIDRVVGILHARDILSQLVDGAQIELRALLRPAYVVPESRRVDELLHDLQRERTPLAIVVDEYGGTAGLVTIEDLIEQIVGEIRDEYDVEEEEFVQTAAGVAVVAGRLTIDALSEVTGIHIDEPDVDTVGGYVTSRLGKLPAVGDEVEFDDATFTVMATSGHRVRTLRVTWHENRSELQGEGVS